MVWSNGIIWHMTLPLSTGNDGLFKSDPFRILARYADMLHTRFMVKVALSRSIR